MSLERQPDALISPSLEPNPPGYAQPTVPPPRVAEKSATSRNRRLWAAPALLGGLLLAVAVDVTGGPALLGGIASVARNSAGVAQLALTSERPALGVHVERLVQAFPEEQVSDACPSFTKSMPLVLASSVDRADRADHRVDAKLKSAEARWINGAAPVTSSFLATQAKQIAVLRTKELVEPAAAQPGRYEGTLVVFDVSTSVPLCSTVVRASSADAPAFGASVRHAVARGAAGLKVAIDL